MTSLVAHDVAIIKSDVKQHNQLSNTKNNRCDWFVTVSTLDMLIKYIVFKHCTILRIAIYNKPESVYGMRKTCELGARSTDWRWLHLCSTKRQYGSVRVQAYHGNQASAIFQTRPYNPTRWDITILRCTSTIMLLAPKWVKIGNTVESRS